MVERVAQNPGGRASAGGVDQLALPFGHRSRFARADFVAAGSNGAARAWLLGANPWPEHRLALWGAAGAGKTHLLEIWAREHDAVLLRGADVTRATLGELFERPGDALRAVAVDDADRADDQQALLHLLNAAREQRIGLVLAARLAPARWPVVLPDLASRLRATMAIELRQPEDALLRILLLRHLADRQIVVSQPVTEWLLRRLPRTASAIREAALRLDQAGLAAGRRVTRALAAAALHDLLDQEETRAS
ncbi:chromosomal replication initiator DnaA [Gluconacetobacter sacchari]|uniref:Chromosomal replication initiator DnaA n=1 Tax=Gluconacetobacter sacchari TaxID=92759 RepID=A0A7W4IEW9_9PROT|nr:chromosomal replication initiator DnaA [Gluconacetobacter sacchari]MBB2161512.1 chromosomal replication initiator DnaA [Gluconacetobacter sacchari]